MGIVQLCHPVHYERRNQADGKFDGLQLLSGAVYCDYTAVDGPVPYGVHGEAALFDTLSMIVLIWVLLLLFTALKKP